MFRSMVARLAVFVTVAAMPLVGCTTADGETDEELVGVQEPEDDEAREGEHVTASLPVGTQLRTNAALNLRSSGSTSARILRVIPKGAIVTVVTSAPRSGWYNIKYSGTVGWSHGDYLDRVSSTPTPTPTGDSCDPARAIGVVSRARKALLDSIAFAEGTRGAGKDGYNVIYSYKYFTNCDSHPNRVICSGSYCSSAAGRYQFLTSTWRGLGLPNFRPENQTRGAMTLMSRRGASIPSDRPMTATEFSNVMYKVSYEWASLPPGRYGQPTKSMSTMRSEYCRLAGC